jgi:hypothetical protein
VYDSNVEDEHENKDEEVAKPLPDGNTSQFNTVSHDQIEASLLQTPTLLYNILRNGFHRSLTRKKNINCTLISKCAMAMQNISTPTVILEITGSITFASIPQTSTVQILNN